MTAYEIKIGSRVYISTPDPEELLSWWEELKFKNAQCRVVIFNHETGERFCGPWCDRVWEEEDGR